MLKIDSEDKNYIWVPSSDILKAVIIASKGDDEQLTNTLYTMFLSENYESECLNENGDRKVNINSDVGRFLLESNYFILYDTYINVNILGDALLRSMYAKDYKINKLLYGYYRSFIYNEINGESNEQIKKEIIENKELMEYIKKYENINDFIKKKINKNSQIRRLK